MHPALGSLNSPASTLACNLCTIPKFKATGFKDGDASPLSLVERKSPSTSMGLCSGTAALQAARSINTAVCQAHEEPVGTKWPWKCSHSLDIEDR